MDQNKLGKDLYEFLRKVERDFSNNQRKQLKHLSPKLGEDIAIALVGIQGRTSRAEIEFIADIIEQFKPIKIYSYRMQPRKIIFEGTGPEGHIVRIHPQYAIPKPEIIDNASKKNYWWIDLAIELHRKFEDDLVRIAVVGFEYDGHVAHYVESEIKRTHLRDVGIMYQVGFQPMHIAPEHWKKHPKLYSETMNRHFNSRIREIQEIDYQALKRMYLEQIDAPEFLVRGSGPIKIAIPLTREPDEQAG